MGKLMRATVAEVEELHRGDPAWWPGVLAHIADRGSLAEIVAERVWSWGALWAWIQRDEERVAQYDGALKARAQMLAFEAVDDIRSATMADVPLRKFKVDAALKVAGKWDRSRYGESSEVKHSGAIGMNLMAVLASLPRAGMEVDVTPEAEPVKPALQVEMADEI